MNILKKLHNFFNKLHVMVFIFLMTTIVYILNILFAGIFLKIANMNPRISYGIIENISIISLISPIFIAPWIETVIFQGFILYLLSNTKNLNRPVIKILVSALSFGLLHLIYNPFYAISAFVAGIIFAYSYLLYEKKNNHPIIVTSIIHAANNALALFLPIIIRNL
ncbi:CPBP family intramembrane glutamic endopeptidase [Clostridium sp. Marseille-Q7071]